MTTAPMTAEFAKTVNATTGQWSVNYNSTTAGVAQICADEKHHVIGIADCFQGEASTHGKRGKYVVSEKEMLANAHLIAAAPELRKACQMALALLEQLNPTADAYLGQPSKGGINVSKTIRQAIMSAVTGERPVAKENECVATRMERRRNGETVASQLGKQSNERERNNRIARNG